MSSKLEITFMMIIGRESTRRSHRAMHFRLKDKKHPMPYSRSRTPGGVIVFKDETE